MRPPATGMRRHTSAVRYKFHSTSGRPVAKHSCMTASTDWPRIGPATYGATTQEDELRREANPQLDEHLKASPQVAESAREPSQGGDTGSNPVWDYQQKRRIRGCVSTPNTVQTRIWATGKSPGHGAGELQSLIRPAF